ncbi:MAG: FAD-dependent oxidoreductase [Bryobacterales bacterium]|nr:FAD-dependent oxidoreductase [Bryobacterales bacterium]
MKRRPKAVVLGGGFAGLEAAFFLRHKLHGKADITLVSNRGYFLFKPNLIYVPFGENPEKYRVWIDQPARRKDIEFIESSVEAVDSVRRMVHLPDFEVPYDYLVIATGAAMRAAEIPGLADHAVTVWSAEEMLKLREQYRRIVEKARERGQKLLFVVPPNNLCPGPLYEMAIMTDTWLREQDVRESVEITFTTVEETYLQSLGPRLNTIIIEEFAGRSITGHRRWTVDHVEPGRVFYSNGESAAFDLLVSFPSHAASKSYLSLPRDERGFLQVSPASGRVESMDRVFAAGDASNYPVKMAFLALLQADAAADHIAAEILRTKPEVEFEPMCITVMDYLNKAVFAQVPFKYTANPVVPVTADAFDEDRYKVGVSPLWRVGKKVMGAYLPWRFSSGEPFHSGFVWGAVDLGLKIAARAMAT